MPTEVKLPEVGDNITEGAVVSVLVKPGDTITEGQAIIEIETDKAVVEVPASAAGKVQDVRVNVGDSVPVGGVILTLEDGGAGSAQAPAPQEPAAQQPAAQEPAPQNKAAAPAPQAAPAAAATGGAQVTLPEVGDNITEGQVVTVLVKPGDTIQEGQPVIEIETDKAVVEVPANASGTVLEVRVQPGDQLAVGGVILTLEGGTSGTEGPKDPQAGTALGASGRGAETDEVTGVAPQRDVAARQAHAQQEAQKQQANTPQHTPSQAAPRQAPQTFDGRPLVPASPSVRRLARELGVDILNVQGSGTAGRISEDDVRRAASAAPPAAPAPQAAAHLQPTQQPVTPAAPQAAPAQQAAPQPAGASAPLPDFTRWGNVRVEDMNGVRKATVRSMTQAWMTIPMVTHFDKADVTRMEEARKAFGARVEKAGGKLTMTSILMKVVANALRRFPKFNASLDVQNNRVIFKEYVSLGIAVDTPNGLLVPVLRDADRKSITELSVEIGEIAQKARDRKLKPDEMQGATFTISNLGGIGGHAFTPIVNPPEVAILGVSRGGIEPVWNKETGAFEPRNMLPLSLTYDHRLIDGADAARFLRFICEALEDPFLISL